MASPKFRKGKWRLFKSRKPIVQMFEPAMPASADNKSWAGFGVKPGSTVTVFKDGVSSGTATADANGEWIFTFGTAPASGSVITWDGVISSIPFGLPVAASAPVVVSKLAADSRIVFFGDSRTNYGTSYVAADRHYFNIQGFTGWLMAALGGRAYAPPGSGKGVVGNTVAQMDARFAADVAPLLPKLLTIWGGVNDLKGSTVPVADMQTSMTSIITKARALSSKPIMFIMTEPASSTITLGRETARVTWNAWLKTLAADDLVVLDTEAVLNMNSTTDSADAVHLTASANLRVSNILAPAIIAKVDALAYPTAGNFLTNSAMAGSGVLPTSWQLFDSSGGATITTQIVTKDGKQWAELTLSGTYTGTGRTVNIYQGASSLPAGVSVGDLLEAFAYLEIDDGAVGVQDVFIGAYLGGSKTRSPHATAETPYPAGAKSYVVRTPPIDYAGNTASQFIMSVMLPTAATATPVSLKCRFALPVFRKVPAGL